jgi:inosose dehydratase
VGEGAGVMQVGCGQITWKGVDEPDALADIAEAGYEGAPPKLRPGRSPAETQELYGRCGLVPAPPYFGAPFWQPERRDEIVESAREAARFSRAIGCGELYVAAHGEYRGGGGRSRGEAAGHVRPEDGLTDGELETFVATLNAVGQATLDEGVRSCFHNHVGTVIETEDEIERMLELTDPSLVFLGPDTGHLAWGGVDAAAFCRRHAARIGSVHLKDIDEDVRRRGSAEEWDYGTFSSRGIFQELGRGSVDLRGVLDALESVGFDGWLIVETDVTQLPSALESARVSRDYLRGLGL